MIRINDISLPLGYKDEDIIKYTAREINVKPSEIKGLKLVKRSVDARKKDNVHFKISVEISLNNEAYILKKYPINKVSKVEQLEYRISTAKNTAHRPVVVGFGPAGMFAALTLAQSGLKPIVLERGVDCDSRTKAVEAFRKNGILDTESNVQFGEGGAGTFSDGKLTTGIRDIRIRHVFETFVRFGAPEEILYLAKPHIGTDILRNVVKNIRNEIIKLGGKIEFGAKLTDFGTNNGRIETAIYEKNGEAFEIKADSIILAIGHSARDTYEMLYKKNIRLEQKNFAMGVRIEHLQSDVSRSLYGNAAEQLPPADYKYAVHLPNGRSLFTFCMCPGGHVMAAASEKDSVVTNGMSYHSRSAVNANSALLVGTNTEDFGSEYELAGMELQRKIERAAFVAAGGGYKAPVTTVESLLTGENIRSFGKVKPSYEPGTEFVMPDSYLPNYIAETLREGIPLIGKRADFFNEREAVLTGPETRSSAPVRIIRGEGLCSLSVKGLYPCGEGAGYAGGIVSAAVDGIKCGEAVIENG